MSNPTITATILANDQASPAIQKLADIAANTQRQVNSHLGQIGKGQNWSGAVSGVNVAFAAMAVSALRDIAKVMSKLSELEARMQAFGGATQKQARDITNTSITQGPMTPGGALGYAQSAKAGLQAGLTPEQAKLVAPHGTHYAKMNETSPEQGTEELLQLTNMWGNFKNQKGETVSPDQLNPKQFEAAVAKTRARYIREARQLPGKPRDLFEFYKMAGPAFEGAGIPEELQGAMAVKMAQGGIAGSHAGTYSRGIVERAITPTAGGRSSLASVGIDINKLMHVNKNAIDPENALKGVQSQVGKLDFDAAKKLKDVTQRLKNGDITYTEAVEQGSGALEGQSKKGGKGTLDKQAATKIVNGVLVNYVDKIDFIALMKELKDKEAGLPIMRKLIGIESGTGAKVLLHSDLGEAAERNKQDAAAKPDREVLKEADTAMMNSLPAAFERLQHTLESLQTQVLAPYTDSAIKVMNTISDFGQAMLQINGPMKDLAGDLALVAAGFAVFKTTAKMGEIAAAFAAIGTASRAAVGPTEAVAGAMGKLAAVNLAGLATSLGALAFAVYEVIKLLQGIPKSEENHNPRVQGWDRARHGYIKPGETFEDLIHSEKWRTNKRFASGNPMDNPTRGSTDGYLRGVRDGSRDQGIYEGGQSALRLFGWNTDDAYPSLKDGWQQNQKSDDRPLPLKKDWTDSINGGQTKPAAEGDAKWGLKDGQQNAPAAQPVPVTVTGDLTGSANITANIVVTPSPLFNAVIEGIKADVLRLKGQVGSSKTGVNLAGSNGAQPVSNPSGGHH